MIGVASVSARSVPIKREVKPHGHWSIQEGINVKLFLDNFAASRNFDPLDAEKWYTIRLKDILREKVCFLITSLYFILFGNNSNLL